MESKLGHLYIGRVFSSNNYGDFKLLNIPKNKRVDIKFLNTGYVTNVDICRLYDGYITDKSYQIKTGDIFETKEGYKIKVIEIISQSKIKIKFLDKYGHETFSSAVDIRKLTTRNPYHPSVHGFGYRGVGNYKVSIGGVHTNEYKIWKGIMYRIFSGENKTYKNVSVCEEWLNFQNFAKWYDENYPKHINDIKFEIDKDLKQYSFDFKIYSPETCVWLPKRINIFIYRKHKNTISISYDKSRNKWVSGTTDFNTGEFIRKRFNTQEEAHEFYLKVRAEQVEKAKDYLRSLNYLPEEIIQLVK